MRPNQLAVLVADDDEGTREALLEVLAGRGIAATVAADGRGALDLISEADPPCMILLDWVMPRLDGEGFLAARAASPRLSAIPVIVMSATHAPAADPRVTTFLQKPLAASLLVETLRETCRTACPPWLRERRGCTVTAAR
jgi:CheY-like chemotaxis protein